jgi:hypothetical protein
VKTILYVFLLLACPSIGLAANKSRESQSDDIYEIVFRYQAEFRGTRPGDTNLVYFLSVGDKRGDPSNELMRRFAGCKPDVRKFSASHLPEDHTPRDRKTGERGYHFSIGKIRWISGTKVKVSSSCYKGYLNAIGEVFTLKKKNGKWTVERVESQWIS